MFLEQSGNRIGFGEGFKSMTINLKQLSKLLKLSPTTVSRALADYPDVSAKTRARGRIISAILFSLICFPASAIKSPVPVMN